MHHRWQGCMINIDYIYLLDIYYWSLFQLDWKEFVKILSAVYMYYEPWNKKSYINFHFSVQAIIEEQIVGHTNPVRFHGMTLSIVIISNITCNTKINVSKQNSYFCHSLDRFFRTNTHLGIIINLGTNYSLINFTLISHLHLSNQINQLLININTGGKIVFYFLIVIQQSVIQTKSSIVLFHAQTEMA